MQSDNTLERPEISSAMPKWNAETAEWYAANYGDYPTNRLAVDHLDLPASSTIVDIGCGTGAALRHAARKVRAGNLIGIDPVPRMIEIACELTENRSAQERITFIVGSAEALPIDKDCADVVFAFDSVDHWQDVRQGLREIRRVLRPVGNLVIVKDRGVPGAQAALKILGETLKSSGFDLFDENEISSGDVSFALWILGLRG